MSIPFLDKCPDYNLFISGFIALRRPKALQNCRITHIVSVLDWQFDEDNPLTRGFQHLHIPVDDVEDENLLVWFPRSNAFIQQGLNYWRTPEAQREWNTHKSIEALDGDRGSGVLIHCAMGKSRSATVLLAYLLWSSRQPPSTSSTTPDMVSLPPTPFTVESALMLLRRGRPIAEPNEGFMDQLYLYVDMGCPTTQSELEGHKLYRRWMNKRNVAESLRINQAPDMVDILFEDENPPKPETKPEPNQTSSPSDPSTDSLSNLSLTTNQASIGPGISAPTGVEPATTHPNANSITPSKSEPPQDLLLKCRKCRHLLARSNFILPHTALHSDPSTHQDTTTSPDQAEPSTPTTAQLSPKCAHIFLHPLSWMRPALSPGTLEGRLTCPNQKCGANIGKFAWQGLRCSCGGWVTPGFGVGRGKVDEVWVGGGVGSGVGGGGRGAGDGDVPGSGGLGAGQAGGALRLPPGMKRDGKI